MKYIIHALFLLQLIYTFAAQDEILLEELLVVLLIVAVYVLKERFWDNILLIIIQLVIVTAALYFHQPLGFLYALMAFEFAYISSYLGVAGTAALIAAFSLWQQMPQLPLLTGVCILLGHVFHRWEKQKEEYCETLDEERHLRYSLESARNKLLASSRETAHLTEIKERNRIAREIHDSIGHSIAGVLVQMQIAQRLVGKDDNKARQTLVLCTEKLKEALTTARETVYNLKPREKLGIDYIERIVEDYTFCEVEPAYEGDFESMPPEHMEATAAIIKEALTNTAKHSKATKVMIHLETNEKFTRLLFKDNGLGCHSIREGMGISGIKERVKNLGGNLSLSSNNGFMIVCVLYR